MVELLINTAGIGGGGGGLSWLACLLFPCSIAFTFDLVLFLSLGN